jgi:uncharacterized protein
MPVKNLPRDLEGKTLMQISDIQVGKRFDHQFIIESFKKATALNPDTVLYTGDYVSTGKDEVQHALLDEVLQHLVKGKMATIGILGNHDFGKNWMQKEVADSITEKPERNGVTMLRNTPTQVKGLQFIGLYDYWGLNCNPAAAIQHFTKNNTFIVLCHNPDVCDLDVWKDYDSWILSGHTHGGQCKPPFYHHRCCL